MVLKSPSSRLYGLDMLRGLAMLLGVVLHGVIPYKAGYHFGDWVSDPSYSSYFFDWVFLFTNSFRMPLFFLLAGFFARLLYFKIGFSAFFKNRFNRIIVPLILGYFIILPLTFIPYKYYFFWTEGISDPWSAVWNFCFNFLLLRERSGLMHLWFLYHLVIYYSFMLCMVFLVKGSMWDALKARWYGFVDRHVKEVYFVVFVILVVAAVVQGFHTAVPYIWSGFAPPPIHVIYFGVFFSFGWFLERHRHIFMVFNDRFPVLLSIGILLSVINLILLVQFSETLVNQFVYAFFFKCGFALQAVFLVFGFLGLFNKKFNTPSTVSRYLSDGAYWIYLVHLPLVLSLQIVLLDSFVPGFLRFPIVFLVSALISIITYHYWVRFTWVGKLLNGKKYEKGKVIEQPG